ncbi:FG-GAP repeat domain-containing protein [Stigmatella aurantiaca]|uniref:FG-GAP repeat domain protein n=1 Tax=Stigmatella aurantiaca (strain DW4/3-1) TaxID=378806 RepID=Q08YE9_STIAD|nr:VCBS repeat-containing protein [Stigmatella aurantiaca]ADO70185.1 FG-GAP repeat domain protein [Stigmatella aurantiaca DW4/3-1]EAU65493.1 FG-GAP repeat domain protein [Stigmatella aurantiaca DW4/3-1]
MRLGLFALTALLAFSSARADPGAPFAQGWFDAAVTNRVAWDFQGWACAGGAGQTRQSISIVLAFGGAGSGEPTQELDSATEMRPDAASACAGDPMVGWYGRRFAATPSLPVYAYAKSLTASPGALQPLGGSPITPRVWHDDIVWRNVATGDVYKQLMNRFEIVTGRFIYNEPSLAWKIVGRGDDDGDSTRDLLWRNDTTGDVFMQLTSAFRVLSGQLIYNEPSPAWQIAGSGDYNGDGKADILWHNSSTGQVFVHLMNGTVIIAGQHLYMEPSTDWEIMGSGDYNGDGRSDILRRNRVTGQVALKLVGGSNGALFVADKVVLTWPDLEWKIVGSGDYSGDGMADILWRNEHSGTVFLHLLWGGAVTAGQAIFAEPNPYWKIVNTSADYNGDNKRDVLWYHEQGGQVFMQLLDGLNQPEGQIVYVEPDLNWQIVPMR